MNTDKDANDNSGDSNKDSLPVAEGVPAAPYVEPAKPAVPDAILKQDSPTDPKDDESQPGPEKPIEPLLVHVTKDDELNSFERRTVRVGWAGIIVGFLSLAAACIAGYIVFQQFKEMNAQTGLMNRAAIQARVDSKDSAIATGKQLGVLQGQLTQQRRALELDQRPWIKFEPRGTAKPGDDIYDPTKQITNITSGQPLTILMRLENLGRTTAKNVRAVLYIEIVSRENPPKFPVGNLEFGNHSKTVNGHAVKITAMGVFYPGEIVDVGFSRVKLTSDGYVDPDMLTIQEVNAINSGKAYILAAGEVWYSDIFGKKHWTRYCAMSPQTIDPETTRKCVDYQTVDGN